MSEELPWEVISSMGHGRGLDLELRIWSLKMDLVLSNSSIICKKLSQSNLSALPCVYCLSLPWPCISSGQTAFSVWWPEGWSKAQTSDLPLCGQWCCHVNPTKEENGQNWCAPRIMEHSHGQTWWPPFQILSTSCLSASWMLDSLC